MLLCACSFRRRVVILSRVARSDQSGRSDVGDEGASLATACPHLPVQRHNPVLYRNVEQSRQSDAGSGGASRTTACPNLSLLSCNLEQNGQSDGWIRLKRFNQAAPYAP